MKNRYKVLIILLSFLALCILVAVLIGLGFHLVPITHYGFSYNKVFGTLGDTSIFTPGRYFIGIDHQMALFPLGLLSYQFTISANTLDKSFLTLQALFLGQFLPSQLSQLNMNYGTNYEELLKVSIQATISQAIEEFTLLDILGKRSEVEGRVYGAVRQAIQTTYPFVKCHLLSLGAVGTDLPNEAVMTENPQLYSLQSNVLQQSYNATKQINFLNVGSNLLLQYERFHGQLFSQVMANILQIVNSATYANDTQKAYMAMYLMSNPLIKGSDLEKVYVKI